MSGATISGGSLLDRIQAVERQVKEVRAAIHSTRRARRMILLLVVLFLVGIGAVMFRLYQRIQSPAFQEQLMAAAQLHLERNADVYQAEIERLVDNTTPVLMAAFRAQVDKDMPVYTRALNEQRGQLLDNLQPQLEQLVTDRYAAILVSYEDIVAEEFPDAARPEVRDRIQANLRSSMSQLVRKYYVAGLQRAVEDIFAAWDAFPPADLPNADSPPLSEQLIGTLLELLTRRVSDPPSEVTQL